MSRQGRIRNLPGLILENQTATELQDRIIRCDHIALRELHNTNVEIGSANSHQMEDLSKIDTHLSGNHTVCLIDPDEAIGEALTTLLATYQIKVQTFVDAETFLSVSTECDNESCFLLVELNLPEIGGLALLRKLRAGGFRSPVVMLTDVAGPSLRKQVQRFGALDLIEKPLIKDFLLDQLPG